MPRQGGCAEEEVVVVEGKDVAATAFEGMEGGMRKSWYLFHLFTNVFLIRILFFSSTDCSEGGICKSYFLFYFIHFFRF